MFSKTIILAYAALSASTLCNAHFFITTPTPIQGSAPKDPLEPSGANFPCHGVSLPSSGGQKMAAGSSQELSFDLGGGANTAVHGGGSCQLSLLYDVSKASDPSAWHVIYSIEGGCPANTKGNLDNGVGAVPCTSADQGDCVHSFNYTIPEGVQSGNAIMSWSWFNTIGNREMYQNCANVEITGGSGSDMGSLPSMFVANIASVTTCATKEQEAVAFPNPGQYVIQPSATNGYNYPLATPSGCSGDGGAAAKGAAPSSSAVADSSSAYAAPTSAPAYSAPVTSSPPAYQTQPAMVSTTLATAYATRPASESAAVPSTPAKASNPDTGGSGNVSCSTDGAIVCIDATHFGMCNFGSAIPQLLAAGTTCSNGVISKRRAIRHAAWHAARAIHVHTG